ncbi:MAG: branched-chain amino acid ABC transporter substrate-binding protein [Acidimicrobiaceae bacterium]|nr:branched-chain amino acid ABC transporter substrate-binding protein [Acidimicrobiaceae bacterium]
MFREHSAPSKRAQLITAVLAVVLAVACAGESGREDGIRAGGNAVGDSSLGVVEVAAGEAVQIRSLEALTGDYSIVGLAIDRATAMAVADYGPIHGFDVDLGASLDDLCSSDGGQAAAQAIVADADVVGVIGTSCSSAAIAAAPLVAAAGMVMISAGATSPALTSDLAGNPGPNRTPGFYRTVTDDVFQGAAMARFVHDELGLSTAAAIHDGDPFTQGLASAFAAAFEAEGGTVTRLSAINKEDSDMVPVLTEIAAGSPQALFLPIFQPAGDFVANQAPAVPGLEDTVLVGADSLLNLNFLSLPQSAGMYFTGPDRRFADNVNQSTGKTAADVVTDYAELYGQEPGSPFWAHAYDATTLLLEAIAAASRVDDGTLVIDRAAIREHLDRVENYRGLTGPIACDAFGDCGSNRIVVVRNIGGEANAPTSMDNIVFSYPAAADRQ